MKKFVNNWHVISVYLAVAVALAAAFIPGDILLKLQLASISLLLLHFYEEFGVPGGFAYMGVKVLLGKDERDKSKWNSNNLSSMYGNWLALAAIYVLPVVIPSARFLVVGAMLFNFLEVFMHLLLFNVRMKSLYNPGLVSAVFGLGPVSCAYFALVFDRAMFVWYDYVLAFVWIVFIFWSAFRSPLYWSLGKKPGYDLSDSSAFGIYL